ncbi:MAG: hypothetical protein M0P57_09010 [Syntrophales bacterium]|nr:hypothetical protein [Syntrophales bacterium]
MAGNKIQLTLAVDDKGSAVISKFSSQATSRLQQMCERSRARVLGLAGTMQQKLGGTISSIANRLLNLKGIALTALAGWGISRLVGDFINLAKVQEDAENALNAALSTTGRYTESLSAHFKSLASSIQEETRAGDEAVLGATALIAQLTKLDTEGLDAATRGAVGLSTVFKQDLNSSAALVAKAFAGNYSALSRYGIAVDRNLSDTEKQASLMEQLSVLYQRAKADVNTFAGAQQQTANLYGDLKEKIGGLITKNQFYIDLVKKAGNVFKELGEKIEANKTQLMGWTAEVGQRIIGMIKNLAVGAARTYDTMSEVIPGIWKQIASMWEGFQKLPAWVQSTGLVGAILGGPKGAILLAGLASLAKEISNEAAGWGLVASGRLGFWEMLNTSRSELDTIIKKFNAENPSTNTNIALPVGLSVQSGGMEARLRGTFSELENYYNKIVNIVGSAFNNAGSGGGGGAGSWTGEQIEGILKVAETDRKALESRLSAYESFYSSLQSKIVAAAESEKRHIEELNTLYRQQADIRKSTESMVLSLRQSTMTGKELYESQRSALNQQYYEAMRLSGQEQIKALEEYKQAVASFAGGYKNGVTETTMRFGEEVTRTVISSGSIIQEAISNIEMAANAQRAALAGLTDP